MSTPDTVKLLDVPDMLILEFSETVLPELIVSFLKVLATLPPIVCVLPAKVIAEPELDAV